MNSDPTCSASDQPDVSFTRMESIFVRHRNALLVRADFSQLFIDYYIHLMEQKIRHSSELDSMLKEHIAMLALHLVARPWAETVAWTANLRAPRVNVFASGGSTEESITGRLFTEDVREPDRHYFYSQTITPQLAQPRTSTLEVTGRDPLRWLEQYYLQSEQRPGRAFHLEGDSYALLAAQPGCDLEWFHSVQVETIREIEQVEETKLLETRRLRFHCGCNLERILPILGSWRHRLDDLFGESDEIQIHCPRCAAHYMVTRDMLASEESES